MRHADLALVGGAGVDHAGDLTAAQNHNPVAQLQQHVQILADIDRRRRRFIFCSLSRL